MYRMINVSSNNIRVMIEPNSNNWARVRMLEWTTKARPSLSTLHERSWRVSIWETWYKPKSTAVPDVLVSLKRINVALESTILDRIWWMWGRRFSFCFRWRWMETRWCQRLIYPTRYIKLNQISQKYDAAKLKRFSGQSKTGVMINSRQSLSKLHRTMLNLGAIW